MKQKWWEDRLCHSGFDEEWQQGQWWCGKKPRAVMWYRTPTMQGAGGLSGFVLPYECCLSCQVIDTQIFLIFWRFLLFRITSLCASFSITVGINLASSKSTLAPTLSIHSCALTTYSTSVSAVSFQFHVLYAFLTLLLSCYYHRLMPE